MISEIKPEDLIEFAPDKDVWVYCGDDHGVEQPESFQFCPLGVQLYTEKPVEEFLLLELTLTLPSDNGAKEEQVQCTGVVAQCCAATNGSNLYRVWVKFIDLNESLADRIRALATSRKFTCPFCENF